MTARHLIAVALLGLALAACSNVPVSSQPTAGLEADSVPVRSTLTAPEAAPTWSPERARAYLDRRAQTWMDERPCTLSCHTTHPYLMADLVLPGQGAPTQDLLHRIDARTVAGDAAAVWYDSDADKVRQSRSTEAVLSAFALLRRSPKGEPASPEAARALARMLAHQRPDGGFDWLAFGLIPWELDDPEGLHSSEIFGAALAAIALARALELQGLDVPVEAKVSLRAWLNAHRSQPGHATDLHNQLMLLWADLTLGGVLTPAEREQTQADAIAVQNADGGWSLGALGPFGQVQGSDGYATGLVVYLLRLADKPVTHPAVQRGRSWLLTHQGEDGAWSARSYNRDRAFNHGLFSDASTAFAVLGLRASE